MGEIARGVTGVVRRKEALGVWHQASGIGHQGKRTHALEGMGFGGWVRAGLCSLGLQLAIGGASAARNGGSGQHEGARHD